MDDVAAPTPAPEPAPVAAAAPRPTHPDDLTIVVATGGSGGSGGSEGLVLLLAGEVDSVRVDELGDALRQHTAGLTVPVLVDLTSLTYLPSMALAVLVRAQRAAEAAGSTMLLRAARGTIAQRVLAAAGVEHRTA